MTFPGPLTAGDAPDEADFDDAREPDDLDDGVADDEPDLVEEPFSGGDTDDPAAADEPATEPGGQSHGGAPQSRPGPAPCSGSDRVTADDPGGPDAAPDEPAGMTPEEAPRSETAPEPARPGDPATPAKDPEPGTDGADTGPKGGMSSEAGPQSRVPEADDATRDESPEPDRNLTPQRMSPDFGDLGQEAEAGIFDDMTLKFGAGASFQLLGQGGSFDIGFTDTGRDDWGLQDLYLTTSWGVGGGLSASGELTGGLVLDSSEFEGMAVETGGSGGALGDIGLEASFPRSRSDGSIATTGATGLNTIDISIGVGAGGELHIRPSNTTFWEVK